MKINIFRHNKIKYLKWVGLGVLLTGILIFILFPYVFDKILGDKSYPNIYIGNENFGLLTEKEAGEKLEKIFRKTETEGFEFIAGANRVLVASTITSLGDPDLSYSLIDFDHDKTLENIFNIKKERNIFKKWQYIVDTLLGQINLPVYFDMDKEKIIEVLKDNFSVFEQPAKDATIVYIPRRGYVVKKEKIGSVFNYEKAVDELSRKLAVLDFSSINLNPVYKNPEIYYNEALSMVDKINDMEKMIPYKVFFDKDSKKFFYITLSDFRKFITLRKKKDVLEFYFNEKFKDFLKEKTKDLNIEPQNAKFEIDEETGKVVQFQESKEGYLVDIQASLDRIADDVFIKRNQFSYLVIEKVKPQYTTADVNDLGIKELLGVGRSNFAGSPPNRVHNIKVASDKLNGLLIPPGEEFSLVKALKPFTQDAGYLPELVIKGNKLIPELGGGVCQIGTTLFRSVLSAGLEITERRNHSFAISYYRDEEGLPGTDATIYDPKPDFRFINNTPSYILIRTIVGDDGELVYELWGTTDGRRATTTKTKVLSKTPAPQTKYIETPDLPKGKTECSGSNVPGYTTEFTYIVEMPDGDKKEKVFKSYYKPWQKVCLVGIGEQ